MSGPNPETGNEKAKEGKDALKSGVEGAMGRKAIDKVREMAKDRTGFFREKANQSWDRLRAFQKFVGTPEPNTNGNDVSDASSAVRKPITDIQKKIEACALVEIPDYRKGEYSKQITGSASAYLRTEVMTDTRGSEPVKYSQVRVDVGAVLADRKQLIEQVRPLFPNNPGVERMIRSLEILASVDPADLASTLYADERSKRPANEAMKFIGKTGAVVVLTGMTLLTGISALVSKKMSIAPFLYGGLLLYLVNPGFFSGRDQGPLKEAANVAMLPNFTNYFATEYRMEGKEWGEVFMKVFKDQTNGGGDLKKYDDSDRGEKKKMELAEKLAPGDRNPARADVLKLIKNEKDFANFRDMLSDVKDPKARTLLAGYVESGSWKMAGKVSPRWRA